MRALVTGASGFVGSRVVRALLEGGSEVHALVRSPSDRLADIDGEAHIVRGDLLEPSAVLDVVGRVRPELCIHCAWYTTPGDYLQSVENTRQRIAAIELAHALAQHGCARLVGVGTCFEYALGPKPLHEMSPVDPRTPYARSKLATYLELDALCATFGMSFAWARLFYLYGPFEDRRRLVPAVTLALLEGRAARTTSGEQLRDFLHVDDVAEALVAIGRSDIQGVVNVGSGEAVPVREIVVRLGALTGRPDLIELGALEQAPNDPPVVRAENRLLTTATRWAPRYTLERGLSQTVSWWSEALRS